MLQGTFQGWNEKTNLFVCGYTSALGKRKLFLRVICPLTCGSSNYCQLSKMLRGRLYGCTVLLCNGIKRNLARRGDRIMPLTSVPVTCLLCVFLLLQVASACPAAWLTVFIERFHMTSRRPHWCSKTMKRRPCWFTKKIPWELNSFLM